MSTPPSTTQIVSVSLGIEGEQRARIGTVNVGTREAELHLLWGSLMLTLTSALQAEHLHSIWQQAAVHARRLPMALGGIRTLSGIDPRLEHPGVVLRLWARPEWNVSYADRRTNRGRVVTPEHVTIRIGGLTWQVYDQNRLPLHPRNPHPSRPRQRNHLHPMTPNRHPRPVNSTRVNTRRFSATGRSPTFAT